MKNTGKIKVDIPGLIAKIDPFGRGADGVAETVKSEGITPKFAAILEFVLSIPTRCVKPEIESMVTTSDGHILANGDYLGTTSDLEGNLREWVKIWDLSDIEHASFQNMLDDPIGYGPACHRVTL